ncbi:MAG: ABC transporter permease [Candidatus Thorarchaeota archaeon]
MIHTHLISASFYRSMRIFLRDKAIFGSSIFVPIFFLLVLPQVLFTGVPEGAMPLLKGYLTIAMIVMLIMTAGMSNLAGSIAGDRNHDLYSKLSSMPISPWSESIGRILTVIVFSSIGSVLIFTLGLATGAELVIAGFDLLLVLGIGLVITLTSIGIGLIISAFMRSESAASHVGVAAVLTNYFIGIAVPYNDLPGMLKIVARLNPLSSANNMIASLAIGPDVVGYDPWTFFDIGLMLTLCTALLITGLFLYSRRCWRR